MTSWIYSSRETNVVIPQPVTIVKMGLWEQSRKAINLDSLKEAVSNARQFMITELAQSLGVHRNTIYNYMRCNVIEQKYSQLTNAELDALITQFKKWKPKSGIWYTVGFLWQKGIRVQHHCVAESSCRIDRVGQVLRNRQMKCRHQYHVKRPNVLWHLDGHHKLIWWGIVIHGIIDGFCWTVWNINIMYSYANLFAGDCFTCK